jgi:hypothetical protein
MVVDSPDGLSRLLLLQRHACGRKRHGLGYFTKY